MAAAAQMLVAIQQFVEPYQDDVRFTVGMWKASPNVPGVIASRVLFSVDLRHPSTQTLKLSPGDEIGTICRANAHGCGVVVNEIANAESVPFSRSHRINGSSRGDQVWFIAHGHFFGRRT